MSSSLWPNRGKKIDIEAIWSMCTLIAAKGYTSEELHAIDNVSDVRFDNYSRQHINDAQILETLSNKHLINYIAVILFHLSIFDLTHFGKSFIR